MNDAPDPPPLPSQPLSYGGPVPPGVAAAAVARDIAIFSIVRFIASLAVMLILVVIFIFAVPRLETVYQDFGVKLPWFTQLILDIGRFLQTPLGWVTALFVAGVASLMIAVLPIRGRWLRLLVLLILAGVVIGLALAVIMPLLNLIESISSPAGKK